MCRRTEGERTAVLGRLAVAEADFPASVEASLQRWYDGTGIDPELVAETRATLLANDLTSYLNCYRVFATGGRRDRARTAADHRARAGRSPVSSTPGRRRR